MTEPVVTPATKGPNFGIIVALFAGFILLFCIAAYLFLHKDAKKVDPHGPNPEPNSMLVLPAGSIRAV